MDSRDPAASHLRTPTSRRDLDSSTYNVRFCLTFASPVPRCPHLLVCFKSDSVQIQSRGDGTIVSPYTPFLPLHHIRSVLGFTHPTQQFLYLLCFSCSFWVFVFMHHHASASLPSYHRHLPSYVDSPLPPTFTLHYSFQSVMQPLAERSSKFVRHAPDSRMYLVGHMYSPLSNTPSSEYSDLILCIVRPWPTHWRAAVVSAKVSTDEKIKSEGKVQKVMVTRDGQITDAQKSRERR